MRGLTLKLTVVSYCNMTRKCFLVTTALRQPRCDGNQVLQLLPPVMENLTLQKVESLGAHGLVARALKYN